MQTALARASFGAVKPLTAVSNFFFSHPIHFSPQTEHIVAPSLLMRASFAHSSCV